MCARACVACLPDVGLDPGQLAVAGWERIVLPCHQSQSAERDEAARRPHCFGVADSQLYGEKEGDLSPPSLYGNALCALKTRLSSRACAWCDTGHTVSTYCVETV